LQFEGRDGNIAKVAETDRDESTGCNKNRKVVDTHKVLWYINQCCCYGQERVDRTATKKNKKVVDKQEKI
jgi:hypothetical protein